MKFQTALAGFKRILNRDVVTILRKIAKNSDIFITYLLRIEIFLKFVWIQNFSQISFGKSCDNRAIRFKKFHEGLVSIDQLLK